MRSRQVSLYQCNICNSLLRYTIQFTRFAIAHPPDWWRLNDLHSPINEQNTEYL